MKSFTFRKVFSCFFMTLLILGITLNWMPVNANSNPDDSIYDCLNQENKEDCFQQDEKDPVENQTDKPAEKTGVTAWEYFKALFAFLFVIGLLFLLLKFINKRNRLYDRNRLMKNMGGISLGQQKSIQLVTIGDKYYLIGVGDDVKLIKEITDESEINYFNDFYNNQDSDLPTGMLDQILHKIFGKKEANPPSTTETRNFNELFRTRMDEMKEERNRHLRRLTEKERSRNE